MIFSVQTVLRTEAEIHRRFPSTKSPMAPLVVKVFPNESEVTKNLCEYVVNCAKQALERRQLFVIGLSGGSLAKYLCAGLPSLSSDWSKWRVFFCDERHVPLDDPDSTYSVYRDNLLSKIPQLTHVATIDPSLSLTECAADYLLKVRDVFPGNDTPTFDVLLLGMGPDGHTCSLFPGHHLLDSKDIVAWINDSPKPPPRRITLTLPVLNNSRHAIFAACGTGKAQMVKRVVEDRTEEDVMPAARVNPYYGQLVWFLDEGAASLLTKK